MPKASAPSISCPGCGSISFAADSDSLPICEYCQVAYGVRGSQCYRCGTGHELTARRCPACGAELLRECLVCGTLNPLDAAKCLVCQQPLDAANQMLARLTGSTAAQMRRTRELGPTSKPWKKPRRKLGWRRYGPKRKKDKQNWRKHAQKVNVRYD